MSLLIHEVPTAEAPLELLLLADPSEAKIRSYLPGAKCFVAATAGTVVAPVWSNRLPRAHMS